MQRGVAGSKRTQGPDLQQKSTAQTGLVGSSASRSHLQTCSKLKTQGCRSFSHLHCTYGQASPVVEKIDCTCQHTHSVTGHHNVAVPFYKLITFLSSFCMSVSTRAHLLILNLWGWDDGVTYERQKDLRMRWSSADVHHLFMCKQKCFVIFSLPVIWVFFAKWIFIRL